MLHAVIMAGGFGTRFWPESRADRPKQLLPLAGGRTMIQSTVDRLGDLVARDRVLIVTNERLVEPIAAQLPQVPREAILGEQCKRDTAPAIGLAALFVQRQDPDAVMIVLPSDHVIRPDTAFQDAVRQAVRLVDKRPERIVTFGIKPTYPAETFGYIERGVALESQDAKAAPTFEVARFREKPKAEQAQQFLASGNFYWNAGIFVWRAQTILDALARHEPEMHARLEKIASAFGKPDYPAVLAREFAAIRAVSIDYAVMERASEVLVIEAPFEWDDVGSWQALARLHGSDAQGNTILGKHLGLNTAGTIVRGSDEHLIVTLGLTDCLIVHTPNATLVASKKDEEALRELVKQLEERGWREYL
jgi:mannose-1-phosphate guanylyltransferase